MSQFAARVKSILRHLTVFPLVSSELEKCCKCYIQCVNIWHKNWNYQRLQAPLPKPDQKFIVVQSCLWKIFHKSHLCGQQAPSWHAEVLDLCPTCAWRGMSRSALALGLERSPASRLSRTLWSRGAVLRLKWHLCFAFSGKKITKKTSKKFLLLQICWSIIPHFHCFSW